MNDHEIRILLQSGNFVQDLSDIHNEEATVFDASFQREGRFTDIDLQVGANYREYMHKLLDSLMDGLDAHWASEHLRVPIREVPA